MQSRVATRWRCKWDSTCRFHGDDSSNTESKTLIFLRMGRKIARLAWKSKGLFWTSGGRTMTSRQIGLQDTQINLLSWNGRVCTCLHRSNTSYCCTYCKSFDCTRRFSRFQSHSGGTFQHYFASYIHEVLGYQRYCKRRQDDLWRHIWSTFFVCMSHTWHCLNRSNKSFLSSRNSCSHCLGTTSSSGLILRQYSL